MCPSVGTHGGSTQERSLSSGPRPPPPPAGTHPEAASAATAPARKASGRHLHSCRCGWWLSFSVSSSSVGSSRTSLQDRGQDGWGALGTSRGAESRADASSPVSARDEGPLGTTPRGLRSTSGMLTWRPSKPGRTPLRVAVTQQTQFDHPGLTLGRLSLLCTSRGTISRLPWRREGRGFLGPPVYTHQQNHLETNGT